MTNVVIISKKNVGVAILLTIIFGPLGMLYSTISGALIMTILSMTIGVLTMGLGMIIIWPICIIWAASAAQTYNQNEEQKMIVKGNNK